MLDVDLLVSRFNSRLDRVLSHTKDPQAFAVDTLVTLWDQFSLSVTTGPSLTVAHD